MVDARIEYVCENGHVESEGALTVKDVNAQGYQEITGVDAASDQQETGCGKGIIFG